MSTMAELPEEQLDALHGKLKSAREALCLAQMLVPWHWSSTVGKAIHIIDEVGSTVPGWSVHNQPEWLPVPGEPS